MLDRSFSSLSAVAQRLLGGWTKWAIWGFTGWGADVAADYLACRCYKVSAGGLKQNSNHDLGRPGRRSPSPLP